MESGQCPEGTTEKVDWRFKIVLGTAGLRVVSSGGVDQYGPQRRHPVPGQVYFGTPNAKVVALDAKTGKVVREKQVADSADGYYCNGAPMIVKRKIVMGTGGPGGMDSRAAVPLREATDGA